LCKKARDCAKRSLCARPLIGKALYTTIVGCKLWRTEIEAIEAVQEIAQEIQDLVETEAVTEALVAETGLVETEVAVETDLVAETGLVETEVAVETDLVAEATEKIILIEDQERCIKLYVLNVKKNVKFLSNQQLENQFIVEIVFLNIKITRNINLIHRFATS